jgi:hypothetical protein
VIRQVPREVASFVTPSFPLPAPSSFIACGVSVARRVFSRYQFLLVVQRSRDWFLQANVYVANLPLDEHIGDMALTDIFGPASFRIADRQPADVMSQHTIAKILLTFQTGQTFR